MALLPPAAFRSRPGCSIEYVPDIKPDLIEDCVIPDPPDPIWQGPVVPPVIPPFNLGCPSIELDTDATTGGGGTYLSAWFSHQSDRGDDNCFPRLYFRMNIDVNTLFPSIPCPSLSVLPVSVEKLSITSTPEATLEIDDVSDDECKYNFMLTVKAPGLDGVSTEESGFGPFLADGSLWLDDNELKFTGTRGTLNVETTEEGSGACVDDVDLDLDGSTLTLTVTRGDCSCTYC